MRSVVLVLVLALAAVLFSSVLAWAVAPRLSAPRWTERLSRRIGPVFDAALGGVGRAASAATVYLAGAAATLILCWMLGKVAQSLQSSVDVPVFDWFKARLHPGPWQHAWTILTRMGNRRETQILSVVAAAVLAFAWRRRKWWLPPAVLFSGYLCEKFGQTASARLVNRGHPPTTHGTWPSGGCARLIVVYGLVIVLTLLLLKVGRRAWVAGFGLLALLATMEAYSRTYLLKHWFTDVLGGLVYGGLVLTVMVAVTLVLDRPRREVSSEPELWAGRHQDVVVP